MDTTTNTLLADYLDDAALAAELKVSVRTIWRWREMRADPPSTRFGKKVYYNRESVARWLKERERQPARAGAR
jgi:hypothetical protein